jgi:uncharacterized protein
LIKKSVITLIKIVLISYLVFCVILYFIQEKLIFFPEKLSGDYKFVFNQKFEELYFTTEHNTVLNGILFKADSSKGLIFYLHGNAGSLRTWGEIARTYTDLHYDLFMLDYNGYGKSEGRIKNQAQLFHDIQLVYDKMKTGYQENKIVILGYSIGTGLATKLASDNHPKLLILQAPYFSLTDMMKHRFPFLPAFLLKYKLETNKFITGCNMPVVIFHGDKDEVIYYGSSLKLKSLLKPGDTLITLQGQAHNGMTDNPGYLAGLQKVLSK